MPGTKYSNQPALCDCRQHSFSLRMKNSPGKETTALKSKEKREKILYRSTSSSLSITF